MIKLAKFIPEIKIQPNNLNILRIGKYIFIKNGFSMIKTGKYKIIKYNPDSELYTIKGFNSNKILSSKTLNQKIKDGDIRIENISEIKIQPNKQLYPIGTTWNFIGSEGNIYKIIGTKDNKYISKPYDEKREGDIFTNKYNIDDFNENIKLRNISINPKIYEIKLQPNISIENINNLEKFVIRYKSELVRVILQAWNADEAEMDRFSENYIQNYIDQGVITKVKVKEFNSIPMDAIAIKEPIDKYPMNLIISNNSMTDNFITFKGVKLYWYLQG